MICLIIGHTIEIRYKMQINPRDLCLNSRIGSLQGSHETGKGMRIRRHRRLKNKIVVELRLNVGSCISALE